MGCDIHAMIERRGKYGWENADEPRLDRNYEIFAVLAGVRNSDDVPVISEPRGLPGESIYVEQPSPPFKAWYLECQEDAHSASWLTLSEIRAFDATQTVYDGSVVTSRDEDGRVTSTARSVWLGAEGDVTTTLTQVGERRIFAWPGWDQDHETEWDQLIEDMERSKREGDSDDDIRLVFFFDN